MKFISVLLAAALVICVSCAMSASIDRLADGNRQCGWVQFDRRQANNATADDEFDADAFRADPEAFPWLNRVVLRSDRKSAQLLTLCAATAVSAQTVLTAAHCVSGHQKSRLAVIVGGQKMLSVENIIVHPSFNATHPSRQHDLAILKIRGATFADNNIACLPDIGDDPVDNCQTAAYFPADQQEDKYVVLSHKLTFGPSVACMETPHLRGYIDTPFNLLCADHGQCHTFVQGPVFCPNADSEDSMQFSLVGLSTGATNWCSVGAYTRLARYIEWIEASITYLEGSLPSSREQHADDEDDNGGRSSTSVGPCASSPCGENSVCWNSGSRFMCTCDPDFPHGNPYYGCSKCVYDTHCNTGSQDGPSKCVNKTCSVETIEQGKIPEEYIKVGFEDFFFVSTDELPWAQAQYECLSKKGHLAELDGSSASTILLKSMLKKANATGRFWIGASDLENKGTFKWFYSGNKLSDQDWHAQGRPDRQGTQLEIDQRDQRCVQIAIDVDGRWAVEGCETKARYVCEHVTTGVSGIFGNSAETNNGGNAERTERQRSFDTLSPKAHHKDVCGRRFVRQSRIVGGGIASYGEWPWQVSLRQWKNGQFRHKCGAAILTKDWIITAAHCVKDVSPSNLLVRVGEYNVLDTREAHEHTNRRITRVITHVNFDKSSYEYDIALLRVVRSVEFQPNAIPICLPSSDDDLVGRTGSVTGWGRRSEFGQISPVLREVHLPIISNAKCMSMYRLSGQNEWIPKIFLCAGTANGGADSCEGDSGGPLVVKGQNGRYALAGVISWGIGCGDRNRPGVYTRISEFRKWIKRNTNYDSRSS